MIRNIIQSIFAFPFSLRQKKLGISRPILSKEDFIDRIDLSGGDRDSASILHEILTEWTYYEGFTPYPGDDLSKVFGISDEELDEDIILNILEKLNIPQPKKEDIDKFGNVNTPLRIAQLVTLARGR